MNTPNAKDSSTFTTLLLGSMCTVIFFLLDIP